MSVWNVKATSNSGGEGKFEKAPAGNHPAVLVGIFDMGTQKQEFGDDIKWQHRAYFVWELVLKKVTGMKDVNHVIGIDLTISLNEKAKLRHWVEARTGKKLPADGAYNIADELGKPCLLNVVEKGGYPKIAGVAAVPDGLTVPAPQRKPVAIDLEQFQGGAAIPEWCPYLYGQPLAGHIRRCREIAGTPASQSPSPAPDSLWDYSDGLNVMTNQTAAQVETFLVTVVNPDMIKVKPAGAARDQAKPATEYGFGVAEYATPTNAGGEIPW